MSNREICNAILDGFSEEQLINVIAILKATQSAIAMSARQEAEDDAFCAGLYEEYRKDPEKGQFSSIEDVAKRLGVEL